MSDPVDKQHADDTQKNWKKSCDLARRAPDPSGAFVAYICDILENHAAGHIHLDAKLRDQMAKRCKRVQLNDVDVWEAVVTLANLLPKRKSMNEPRVSPNAKGT
jgi:hypothetical protein